MNTELLKSKLLEAAFNGSLTHADTSKWNHVKLGEIAEYRKGPFGSSLTKAMFVPQSEDTIKVYEQQNAIKKDYSLGHYYIACDKYETMKSFTVQPNEIIVSCAGTIGETYILPQDAPIGIINQALMRVKTNASLVTNEYWCLLFKLLLIHDAEMKGAGVAIVNIPPFSYLKNIPILLPSIHEQKQIIATLDEGFAAIDAIAAAKDNLSTTAEMLRSKILQAAFEGTLTGADASVWKKVKLENACTILDGKRIPITKNQRTSGDIPYYGATGIVDYVANYIFDEKLVLIGEDGARWGADENSAFIIEGKTWVNNHAHVVRPLRDMVIDEYLVAYLNHADLLPYVTGVTVPKLNQVKMRSILIPLPPLAEQQRIVAKIEELFAEIDKLK